MMNEFERKAIKALEAIAAEQKKQTQALFRIAKAIGNSNTYDEAVVEVFESNLEEDSSSESQ